MAASERGGVSLCDGEGSGASPDAGCVVKALSVRVVGGLGRVMVLEGEEVAAVDVPTELGEAVGAVAAWVSAAMGP